MPNNALAKPSSISFATGNANKLSEVKAILAAGETLPFEVVGVDLDLPELQGEPEDIALEKCRIAAKELGGAVMVEDTCLCFSALNGLPGPYIKWFLAKIGHAGLNSMLHGFEDKSAWAQCTFAYTSGPDEEPKVFIGETMGSIVQARSNTEKVFGWDPIFEPDDIDGCNPQHLTFAEMSQPQKNQMSHRYRALDALRLFLIGSPKAA